MSESENNYTSHTVYYTYQMTFNIHKFVQLFSFKSNPRPNRLLQLHGKTSRNYHDIWDDFHN